MTTGFGQGSPVARFGPPWWQTPPDHWTSGGPLSPPRSPQAQGQSALPLHSDIPRPTQNITPLFRRTRRVSRNNVSAIVLLVTGGGGDREGAGATCDRGGHKRRPTIDVLILWRLPGGRYVEVTTACFGKSRDFAKRTARHGKVMSQHAEYDNRADLWGLVRGLKRHGPPPRLEF